VRSSGAGSRSIERSDSYLRIKLQTASPVAGSIPEVRDRDSTNWAPLGSLSGTTGKIGSGSPEIRGGSGRPLSERHPSGLYPSREGGEP